MTSSKLRRGQLCPLHNSYFCCGRETVKRERFERPKFYRQSTDVRVVEDKFHPRGFREICSARELARRKYKLMQSGMDTCFYCKKPLDDFRTTELAHMEPKGMGGGRRDDSFPNLTLAHRVCNRQNGSRRPVA